MELNGLSSMKRSYIGSWIFYVKYMNGSQPSEDRMVVCLFQWRVAARHLILFQFVTLSVSTGLVCLDCIPPDLWRRPSTGPLDSCNQLAE
ncbi:uncharacterized protein BO80DRAFT_129047 [Aspergillus ibericus CBS 121593]|uniref:Uncharacterized protein n=1 Tax=Aspergillus ibericus CBS 121593 TaxID=1448316 RepID=A0A395GUY9_9EURO|nr:hypothetical protein BO80DRAFT_129047 [Aspergillus ibericus CBS 121593]RAK99381.1 hypothetical protein BO80DRAFT_129047 [Aspergillus ibericus CBS 121593]